MTITPYRVKGGAAHLSPRTPQSSELSLRHHSCCATFTYIRECWASYWEERMTSNGSRWRTPMSPGPRIVPCVASIYCQKGCIELAESSPRVISRIVLERKIITRNVFDTIISMLGTTFELEVSSYFRFEGLEIIEHRLSRIPHVRDGNETLTV